MNPAIRVADVTHRYGSVVALDGVSLDLVPGEFVTLLGPSGCGKTTLLRIVAGFEQPDSGTVFLDGQNVTSKPPNKRHLHMVFQQASLFPHLDVAGNVDFGLRIAGIEKNERRRRIDEALALVRLDGYGRRRAYELSGGQMQRVALARVLVNRPRVILLDEPLSALDLKIRLEMEGELRRIHRETGATFVYVTHDQREALSLSDRIAVFNNSRIEQVGTPEEIYKSPRSPFVARFVGDANVVPGMLDEVDGARAVVSIGGMQISVAATGQEMTGPVWVVVRPEQVRFSRGGEGLEGRVSDLAFRGLAHTYEIDVAGLDQPFRAEVSADTPHPLGSHVTLTWAQTAPVLLRRDP